MNSSIDDQSQRLLWTFGNAEFDETTLRVSGEPVKMEPRALSILRCLLLRNGTTVTKSELRRAVWGHQHLSANVLSNGIGKLRKALHDQERKIIVTNYKIGYQLTEPVTRSTVRLSRNSASGASPCGAGAAVTQYSHARSA